MAGAPRRSRRAIFNHRKFGRDICVVRTSEAQEWRQIFTKQPASRTAAELQQVDKSLASRVQFFFKLPKAQRLGLYKVCRFVPLRKGETLFHQGDIGNTFYIILKGLVDVNVAMTKTHNIEDLAKIAAVSHSWTSETVDFTTVATLGPMQSFGEMALEDSDSKRKAAVVAVEETWLLGITGTDYHMVQEEWRTQQLRLIAATLQSSTIFGNWTPDAVAQLATHVHIRVAQPGDVIVAQDAPVEDIITIMKGQCTVVRKLPVDKALIDGLERVGSSLWQPDTEYTVHESEGGDTHISVTLRNLGKFDVYGIVSAINLTPSPYSFVADTRVELLVLHRDDVVSAIAAGAAPAESFQLACRLESCMYPADKVLLERLQDEYNWKLFKLSLLQHDLVTRDGKRHRERRRLAPGAMPKAASAAQSYLPPHMTPLAKPPRTAFARSVPATASAAATRRRRGRRHRPATGPVARASPAIEAMFGHLAHKPPGPATLPANHRRRQSLRERDAPGGPHFATSSGSGDLDDDDDGSGGGAGGGLDDTMPQAFTALQTRRRQQAQQAQQQATHAKQAHGTSARRNHRPSRSARAATAPSHTSPPMLAPMRGPAADIAVMARLPAAWKLQQKEAVQFGTAPPTPKRRARATDATASASARQQPSADTSTMVHATPRLRPRPPQQPSQASKSAHLAMRARHATVSRHVRRATAAAAAAAAGSSSSSHAVTAASMSATPNSPARNSVASSRSRAGFPHFSRSRHQSMSSFSSAIPRGARNAIPPSTSISRRVALASKKVATVREKLAHNPYAAVRKNVMNGMDSFAERHAARKMKNRNRKQASSRSVLSSTSGAGSMFALSTLREELSMAMQSRDRPPLLRAIPRTPRQTSEIFRQFRKGTFDASAFVPVQSLLGARRPTHATPTSPVNVPRSPAGTAWRQRGSNNRSRFSFRRGIGRSSSRSVDLSFDERDEQSEENIGATVRGARGGQAAATDAKRVVRGAVGAPGGAGRASERDDDGSSDEEAENEIQDAYFEVFGVSEADVEGVPLTQDELEQAPRWWYKEKQVEPDSDTSELDEIPQRLYLPAARKSSSKADAHRPAIRIT